MRGCGEASVCEKERAGKQSRLTIFCDATGAGSSLYFRALSGACDSDMLILRARWRSKDAGKTGLSAGRRGLGAGAVALACNFTRSRGRAVGLAAPERRDGREINVNVLKPLMHARRGAVLSAPARGCVCAGIRDRRRIRPPCARCELASRCSRGSAEAAGSAGSAGRGCTAEGGECGQPSASTLELSLSRRRGAVRCAGWSTRRQQWGAATATATAVKDQTATGQPDGPDRPGGSCARAATQPDRLASGRLSGTAISIQE